MSKEYDPMNPDSGVDVEEVVETAGKIAPRWNVILLDSNDFTFEFVIMVLVQLFKKEFQAAVDLTYEVHMMGRAIVETCSKERAELYVEQVKSFGADPFIKPRENQDQHLGVDIEPAED